MDQRDETHFSCTCFTPIAFAAIAVAAQAPAAQVQIVVRFAHVAPISGAQANFGKDNEYGVRLAIEELNARGAGPSRLRRAPRLLRVVPRG